jgi:1-acyl-sn-glycerol-3-phosphate acyltransferase
MTTTSRTPPAAPAGPTTTLGYASPPARPVDRPNWVWRMCQLLVRVFASVVFDLKVYGIRNIPRTGGVLIVSNHQSLLDPPLLGARMPRPMSYMAKSELFKHKAFAWLIRRLGAFPVKQGAGDVGAIKETVNRLQEGRVLNIFPEGSRTENGEVLPMQPGVGLVVRRAGVPIVPAAICGSYEAWPKGSKYFRRHPVRVVYGPPIDVTGMKADAIVKLIDRSIRTLFERLRSGKMNDKVAAEPLQ